jgi:hypothetical protein
MPPSTPELILIGGVLLLLDEALPKRAPHSVRLLEILEAIRTDPAPDVWPRPRREMDALERSGVDAMAWTRAAVQVWPLLTRRTRERLKAARKRVRKKLSPAHR